MQEIRWILSLIACLLVTWWWFASFTLNSSNTNTVLEQIQVIWDNNKPQNLVIKGFGPQGLIHQYLTLSPSLENPIDTCNETAHFESYVQASQSFIITDNNGTGWYVGMVCNIYTNNTTFGYAFNLAEHSNLSPWDRWEFGEIIIFPFSIPLTDIWWWEDVEIVCTINYDNIYTGSLTWTDIQNIHFTTPYCNDWRKRGIQPLSAHESYIIPWDKKTVGSFEVHHLTWPSAHVTDLYFSIINPTTQQPREIASLYLADLTATIMKSQSGSALFPPVVVAQWIPLSMNTGDEWWKIHMDNINITLHHDETYEFIFDGTVNENPFYGITEDAPRVPENTSFTIITTDIVATDEHGNIIETIFDDKSINHDDHYYNDWLAWYREWTFRWDASIINHLVEEYPARNNESNNERYLYLTPPIRNPWSFTLTWTLSWHTILTGMIGISWDTSLAFEEIHVVMNWSTHRKEHITHAQFCIYNEESFCYDGIFTNDTMQFIFPLLFLEETNNFTLHITTKPLGTDQSFTIQPTITSLSFVWLEDITLLTWSIVWDRLTVVGPRTNRKKRSTGSGGWGWWGKKSPTKNTKKQPWENPTTPEHTTNDTTSSPWKKHPSHTKKISGRRYGVESLTINVVTETIGKRPVQRITPSFTVPHYNTVATKVRSKLSEKITNGNYSDRDVQDINEWYAWIMLWLELIQQWQPLEGRILIKEYAPRLKRWLGISK